MSTVAVDRSVVIRPGPQLVHDPDVRHGDSRGGYVSIEAGETDGRVISPSESLPEIEGREGVESRNIAAFGAARRESVLLPSCSWPLALVLFPSMGLSRFSKPKNFERHGSGSVDDGGGGTLWKKGARWGTSWGAADSIGDSFLDWIGGASEAFSSSADN